MDNVQKFSISEEEVKDFLLYKIISSELNSKLTRLMAQDQSLSKQKALELLLDYLENQKD